MSAEKTPQEVMELAQQRMAARRYAEAQAAISDDEARFAGERPWRMFFAGALIVLLLALLFAPGMSIDSKMYAVVHGVCAQQHNVLLGGLQLPMCARNTGIYAGVAITVLFLLLRGRERAGKLPPLPILVVLGAFVAILALDGFNSMFKDLGQWYLYEPRNDLRTLTGLGMGVALGTLVLFIMNIALRRDVDDQQPVLQSWWELGALLGITFLVLAAMYGNIGWMYWPIAAVAWIGITGQLYAVHLLLVATLMGYDGKITRLRQLARPATIALATTLLMLLGLSVVRFWLELQGLVV